MAKEKKIATPWNVSKRATAKVKDALSAPTTCNCCESDAIEIADNSKVYNGRSYGKYPWIYLCGDCGAYVGIHPFTNIPLGTLANAEMRDARKASKAYFTPLYESGDMDRNEAYARLADKLGIPKSECHFAWFDVEMCEKAKIACEQIANEAYAPPAAPEPEGIMAQAFKKLGFA